LRLLLLSGLWSPRAPRLLLYRNHRYIRYMRKQCGICRQMCFLGHANLSSCLVARRPKPPPLDADEEKMLANYVPVFVMLPV
jgi:hypothetical protein